MILLLQSAQTRVQTLNSRVQFNNDVDMSLWCQIDYNGEISNEWVAGSAAQPALSLFSTSTRFAPGAAKVLLSELAKFTVALNV